MSSAFPTSESCFLCPPFFNIVHQINIPILKKFWLGKLKTKADHCVHQPLAGSCDLASYNTRSVSESNSPQDKPRPDISSKHTNPMTRSGTTISTKTVQWWPASSTHSLPEKRSSSQRNPRPRQAGPTMVRAVHPQLAGEMQQRSRENTSPTKPVQCDPLCPPQPSEEAQRPPQPVHWSRSSETTPRAGGRTVSQHRRVFPKVKKENLRGKNKKISRWKGNRWKQTDD